MKSVLIYIFVFFINLTCFSQEWRVFYAETDLDGLGLSFIEVDEQTNSVWLCNYKLARKFNQGEITTVYDMREMANLTDVEAVYIKNDTVYAASALHGLFMFENNVHTWLSSNLHSGKDIFIDKDDTIWVATSGFNQHAFYGFKNGNYTFYNQFNTGLNDASISNIIKDKYDRFWCTHATVGNTGNGVGYKNTNNQWFEFYSHNSNLPTSLVTDVYLDKSDVIWVATKYGFCRFDEVAQDWIVYDKSNTNLPSDYITDIDFDKQGRMWVMMKDTGLAYSYNYTDWVVFDDSNSPLTFNDNHDNEFLIDTLDNVWVRDWNDLKVLSLDGFGDTWLSAETPKTNEVTIKVYPNPATNVLNITGINANIMEYKVHNLMGQAQNVLVNNNQIDVSLLVKGTYFLQIKTENSIVTKRFMKK